MRERTGLLSSLLNDVEAETRDGLPIVYRTIQFATEITEVVGFHLPPADCHLKPGGGVSLYDAIYNAVIVTSDFSSALANQGHRADALIFILTHSMDRVSSCGTNEIKTALAKSRRNTHLNRLDVHLLGMGIDDSCTSSQLLGLCDEVNFASYYEEPLISAASCARTKERILEEIAKIRA
jgi:hypothetical protein